MFLLLAYSGSTQSFQKLFQTFIQSDLMAPVYVPGVSCSANYLKINESINAQKWCSLSHSS